MELNEFIKYKIESNNLGLDSDVVFSEIMKMKESGIPHNEEPELFYLYLLNLLGEIILTVDNGNNTRAEMLGWLKVKNSIFNDKKMYFFRFETEEDYYNWLNIRKDIYSQLDDIKEIRIINFIELSTFDFISDNITNCKYEIFNRHKKFLIQKAGMLCTKDNSKFMKTLANYFNDNLNYKPIE